MHALEFAHTESQSIFKPVSYFQFGLQTFQAQWSVLVLPDLTLKIQHFAR